jgi:hypothetical protein
MAAWLNYLNDCANGLSHKQIADKHSVSLAAVNKGLRLAKVKVNAKTLCEAVYRASKSGLICALIFSMQYLELDMVLHPADHGDMSRRGTRTRLVKRNKKDLDFI